MAIDRAIMFPSEYTKVGDLESRRREEKEKVDAAAKESNKE